jgi:hypothetical protein
MFLVDGQGQQWVDENEQVTSDNFTPTVADPDDFWSESDFAKRPGQNK